MALYAKGAAGVSGVIYISTLKLDDTDASNYLTLDWNENSAADRTLNLVVGAGDRTLTISGNATLNDWFDQSVKAAATPTLAGLTLTAFSGILKATAGVVAGGATATDIGLGSVENTALSTWAGTVNITTLGTIGTGTWNATAIGDSKISSAATWNAKQTQGAGLDAINAGTWTGANSITTLGTIGTGTWNATAISVGKGGTGLTSYAIGDILYASAADTIGKLVDVATGSVIVSGGVGAAPAYSASPTITTSLTVPTITLGSVTANGILNLYGLHANGYYSIIKGSNAEGLVGADLRIGLDETNRTLIICDRSDIDTDLGLTAATNPTINIRNAAGTGSIAYSSAGLLGSSVHVNIGTTTDYQIYINNTGTAIPVITTGSGRALFIQLGAADIAFGNVVNIADYSGNAKSLTDSDGQQSWLYLLPTVKQTGTAAFDAIYVNPTLTSVGTGATGDGNNLLRLAVSATTKFKVDTAGSMTFGQTSVSLADNAVHDTGIAVFYGMLIVKDTTTGVSGIFRLDGGATPVVISAHANFSTTQGTNDKVNVYFSTTYKIENCNAAASVVKAAFIGC